MAVELNTAPIKEAGGSWTSVKSIKAGMTTDELIVRSVAFQDIRQLDSTLKDLKLRTSVSNPANVEKNFVDNPYVDGKAKAGRWRNVKVEGYARGTDKLSCVITQTLALGLIQKYVDLDAPVLVGAHDRLISPFARLETAQKDMREIKYKAIDPAYAEAIKDNIALTSGVVAAKVAILEDGSANIHVLEETNTWVTADKDSDTEDTFIDEYTADADDPIRTRLMDWNNITQTSVRTIIADPLPDWATGTAYVVHDVILDAGTSDIYICVTAHTAGTFATDRTSGYWQKYGWVKIEGRDNLDGSGKVVLRIEKVWEVSAVGDLPEPQVNRRRWLLKPFSVAAANTSYAEKIVAKYRRLDPEDIMNVMDTTTITDAQLRTDIGNASGFIVVDRIAQIFDDGTMTFTVILEDTTWSNTTPDYERTGAGNVGGYGEVRQEQGHSIDVTTAEGFVEDLTGDATAWAAGAHTALDIVTQGGNTYICATSHVAAATFQADYNSGYWIHILSARYVEGKRGEAKISKASQRGAELVIETARHPQSGRQRKLIEQTWYRVAEPNRTTRYASGIAYAPAGYTHKGVQMQVRGDGYATIVAQASDLTGGFSVYPWINETGLTRYVIVRRKKAASDDYQWHVITITYDVTYHATETAAYQAIDGSTQLGQITPSVSVVRRDLLWRAIKITDIVGAGTAGNPTYADEPIVHNV